MSLGEAVLQLGGVGQNTSDDIREAIKWITKASDQGYAPAQNELGNLYSMNKVHAEDDKEIHGSFPNKKAIDKAIELYRKAAKQGYANAEENLANAYASGKVGEHWGMTEGKAEADMKEAFAWHQKAADQGYALAQFSLGECYKKGEGVEKDVSKAVEWYTKSAEQGNFWAQSSLGDAYLNGQGVEKSIPDAIKWFDKAGKQGEIKANRILGNLYSKGNGVEKNPKKAIEYWEKAAGIGGDEVAMCHLGDAYFEGNGVSKDLQKAYQWHHRAGNLGYPRGAFAAAEALINGWGVEKNLQEAKEWYAAAAVNNEEKVYPPALIKLYQLGDWSASLVLGQGYFGSKSEKGVEWMKKAAAAGSVEAVVELANAYYGGEILRKDQIEGLAWMYVAVAAESNKQVDPKSQGITSGIPYKQAANNWAKSNVSSILYYNSISTNEIDKYDKDPSYLINIAKQLSESWGKELGKEASLKAQQRAKELSAEINGQKS